MINVDSKAYIKSPAEWIPIEGSLEAIAKLNRFGYRVVIATNQSGLARGLFTPAELDQIHEKLRVELRAFNGTIEGIFYCPHGPQANCACRKPKTGMLEQIEEFFECKLSGSPFIGDSTKDILAAQKHGCSPVLVMTGNGKEAQKELLEMENDSFEAYSTLATAVDSILKNSYV